MVEADLLQGAGEFACRAHARDDRVMHGVFLGRLAVNCGSSYWYWVWGTRADTMGVALPKPRLAAGSAE